MVLIQEECLFFQRVRFVFQQCVVPSHARVRFHFNSVEFILKKVSFILAIQQCDIISEYFRVSLALQL